MKDPAYLSWVRRQPCYVCGSTPSEAHHRTGAGMGRKASDHDTMPLCTRHHREFHDLSGHFRGWRKMRIREWQADAVTVTAANYTLHDTGVF